MLHALADRHDVTVLTGAPWDPRVLDACFGTDLAARPLRHRRLETPWSRVLDAIPVPLHLLRTSLLLRHARRLGTQADLIMSADNEMPLGGTGINYVHYPARARPRPAADLRWYHWRAPLALYYAVSDGLAGFDADDVSRQVLLANSRWSAARIRALYGVEARVLHPPVAGPFVARAWDERDDVVLSVGRFSPEKAFERVVAVVEALRRRGHALALTIVGSPGVPAYERQVRALAAERPWLTILGGLDRPALATLMSRCRFGLHGMIDEHFGMAPAELVEAGCLTFVHASGGQTEIVAHDDLTYRDVDDAVVRIERALRDDGHRTRLLAHVAALRGRFAPAAFCAEVRAVVDATLAR